MTVGPCSRELCNTTADGEAWPRWSLALSGRWPLQQRQAYNGIRADPSRKTGDCRGLSREGCSRCQSTSTSEWSHAQEDGYNYEMAYAPDVSSTCPGEVGVSGDWGMETGVTGPCLLGPQGLAGLAGLGKPESLVGKVQAVKGLPCLPSRGVGHRRRSVAGRRKTQVPRDQRRPASVFILPEDRTQTTIRSVSDETVVSVSSWKTRWPSYSQSFDARLRLSPGHSPLPSSSG